MDETLILSRNRFSNIELQLHFTIKRIPEEKEWMEIQIQLSLT